MTSKLCRAFLPTLFVCFLMYTILLVYLSATSNQERREKELTEQCNILQEHGDYSDKPGQIKKAKGATKFRLVKKADLPPESQPGWTPGNPEMPVNRLPKALLLGFAKCGTSALLAFLDIHPDIVTLDWETDYFCDRVYYKYSLHWYRMRMPVSTSHQVTVEKSPCYISEVPALERIRAFNSSIKVMVIVRDPITRILSQYSHEMGTVRTFGIKQETLEEKYISASTGEVKEYPIHKWAIYSEAMEDLYKLFPRSQVLVLDGDAFISDPLSQMKRIETFLGVRKYFSKEDVYFDEEKGFYCYHRHDSNESICMGSHKGRKHVAMEPHLKKTLQDYIRPYSEQFFKLIGHRLKNQVLVLDGDAFISDPLSQMKRVEAFLGVRKYFSKEDVYFDEQKGFYCYRRRGTNEGTCMEAQKGRKHVDMEPNLKETLQHYIRPYSEQFFKLIGHRLKWEGF